MGRPTPLREEKSAARPAHVTLRFSTTPSSQTQTPPSRAAEIVKVIVKRQARRVGTGPHLSQFRKTSFAIRLRL
jgi:hypothetical protein